MNARVHVAVVRTAGLCTCNERLLHVHGGYICACKRPNCKYVRSQPRVSFSAPRIMSDEAPIPASRTGRTVLV
eukprot:6990533-Alexandrium_andersonii.AAC.1